MKLFNEQFFLYRWLQRLPIPGKFDLLIIVITVTIPITILEIWFSVQILTATRAYVGGESLWSKAQKDATYSLIRFSISGKEEAYQEFLHYLQIPLGDKVAREELEKANPDYEIIRQGFLQGGNDRNDIASMAMLFRFFRHYSYIDRAITIWAEGDRDIAEMRILGDQLHSALVSGDHTPTAEEGTAIVPIMARITVLNDRLTDLEKDFAFTLGDASRHIKKIILLITISSIIFIGFLTVAIAIFLRQILERVDRAKTEFVSLASHQLRTPLTVMNWYVEKLVRDYNILSDKKRQDYINEIGDANYRMDNLVDSLLSASRIEMGAFEISPEQVDFEYIARRVIDDLSPLIQKKSLVVSFNAEKERPFILSDAKLTEMIFQNLISNAVKYTPDGGSINISITYQGDSALFTVADMGYGIPSSEQSKIYNKLFRTKIARQHTPSGTGLGLYITKLAVERCGGKVWFHSAEKKGTTFYVIIPSMNR